jgi:hypothetical protein
MTSGIKMTMKEKVELFLNLFQGLQNVYGTYSTNTGKHWQIKRKITGKIIENHLMGKQPYGFYPLVNNKTTVGIADFDNLDPRPPIKFIKRAEHYGLFSYLEKSKSKGYHVWLFFPKDGVSARKIRIVMKYILDEMGSLNTEIFPKQNSITENRSYGNFINAPLFGKLIPEGKTIFIHADNSLKPYFDQWELLETIERNSEKVLDSIIDINNLREANQEIRNNVSKETVPKRNQYGLPICIRRILCEGVTFDQRVACFRIAVNLKRVGLPEELVVVVLNYWRLKNKPLENKGIITQIEIKEQVRWAYEKNYTGYGCQETVVKYFCVPECNIIRQRNNFKNIT